MRLSCLKKRQITQDFQGYKKLQLRIFSGNNNAGNYCPHYVLNSGLTSVIKLGKRKLVGERYRSNLEDVEGISLNPVQEGVSRIMHIFRLYSMRRDLTQAVTKYLKSWRRMESAPENTSIHWRIPMTVIMVNMTSTLHRWHYISASGC